MPNILITSTLALSLSTVGVPAFAQTQQNTQGQTEQGQSTKCPAGTQCPTGDGQKSKESKTQGSTQQNETQGATQQNETQGSTKHKKKSADTQKSDTQQSATEQKKPDMNKTQQPGKSESSSDQKQSDQQQSGANTQSGNGQSSTEQNTDQGSTKQSNQSKSQSTQETQGSNSTTTNVTVKQKTEITQVIREEKVRPIDVDFDVAVGVVVPQATKVKLRPLPTRIVKVVPRYEGYLFFVLADGRIAIVDPSSLEIVLILA
ncbi:DUF1236 domain-containing protein (plasmid) [Ensifer adhaerens]|uniref:DUF1236 domain-containing protein n=1 Tax=Ensifer adhaerens TaxID=106592 RepID=UPI001CBF00A5|nr:DUF1236 domain-containing protein [Ensifer adhaerens]MBZ7927664.1 DUF1236 domain-containing protein [Ensifer adhaerens]UAX98059.1 DUF1236 domain-containing protein [Ensifer adhaerens]UAY05440.1 DUF1236 domain-containing protein [Ensifer adhaerens]UAY12818.1 DUF1236 domain-containing protein [Ensifer adhaerens]